MTRQECEQMIGEKLEEIRCIVKQYNPDIKLVSMYVSEYTSSAWAFEENENREDRDYLIRIDITQEVENDDDC